MLGHIDQRHGEIARGTQNGKSQGTDQHDVASGGAAALPKGNSPSQQPDGQYHRNPGMDNAQLFKIAKAASPRPQFAADGGIKPVVFEAEAAEGAHQRHVVDDIDHFAVDGRGLIGEIVVQRLAGGRQVKHRNDHCPCDYDQSGGHRHAHGADQRNRRNRRDARRQYIPDEHVLDGENGIGCGRNATGQHSWQPIGKIARRMAGQMAKDVAAEITGHAHKCGTRGPARDAPKEIVGCYQQHKKNECQPYAAAARGARRQPVDKKFDPVLGAYRTSDRSDNRGKDNDMRCKPLMEIAQHECERAIRVS